MKLQRFCYTFLRSWRSSKASLSSGFCQHTVVKKKMESTDDFKDFGPLVGAIDQGTSSSRFLVSLRSVLDIGAWCCKLHWTPQNNRFVSSTNAYCYICSATRSCQHLRRKGVVIDLIVFGTSELKRSESIEYFDLLDNFENIGHRIL